MIDFLIITALPEELDAILEALDEYEELDKEYDTSTYYASQIATRRKSKDVYEIRATCLSGMGPINAAAHAVVAASRWQAQSVLMVGIAGGFGGDVALGDILLAEQVADYTLGKVSSTPQEDVVREIRWTALPTDRCLLDSAIHLKGWRELMPVPPEGAPTPKLATGTVVSGGDVITATRLAKEHRITWPKIVGFEMEGGAIATALHATFERPRFFMVRSVQDLADSNKAGAEKAGWRAFACQAAARFAVALLRRGPLPAIPPPVQPPIDLATPPTSSAVARSKDVAALRRIMNEIALDEFDHFIERGKEYGLPTSILHYYHGFVAAQRATLNYIVDPELRARLERAVQGFDAALAFQNHFSPRGGESRMDIRGVADSEKVLETYFASLNEAENAMFALTSHIRHHWHEVDLEQTSRAAREALGEDEARLSVPRVTPKEQPFEAGTTALEKPAARPAARVDPTAASIYVLDVDGKPVANATVTTVADNNTFKDSISNDRGLATFLLPNHQRVLVLVAHPDRPGAIFPNWDPTAALHVTLPERAKAGSLICHKTAHIPGLAGRLNPILDTQNRMYLYADNIAIRDGEPQPAPFQIGVPFKLEDSNGVVAEVTVLQIRGRTSLLEYVFARADGA